jgi:hypothetical protein
MDGAYLKKIDCQQDVHVSTSIKWNSVRIKIEMLDKAQDNTHDADFNPFKCT